MVPLPNGDHMNASPFMIGIDWGTSSFRAYLMDADGKLVDSISHKLGILNVPDQCYGAVLDDACEKWLKHWPNIPVLMCGMIGSRQGWCEAPYLTGDVGAAELSAALSVAEGHGRDIRIIPGLQGCAFGGGPDVMRGEETILLGALTLGAPQTGLYCLPGTHSKWVEVSNGKIGRFSTFLTGELFSMLCDKSILSALIEDNPGKPTVETDAAFLRGVELAFQGEGLLHQLFAIRARVLTDDIQGWATREILSGLLIGTELSSVHQRLGAAAEDIIILSAGKIGTYYEKALKSLGFSPQILDADDACRMGLYSIASGQFGQAKR